METIEQKISRLNLELNELIELKKIEDMKDIPDVVGKFFHEFGNTVIKVTHVNYYDQEYREYSIECEEISINKDSVSIDLDTFYNDIKLDSEINKEEYLKWYDKAIEFIEQQKRLNMKTLDEHNKNDQ